MLLLDWDAEKAKANFAKHGVSFDEAAVVLDDPMLLVRYDDRFDYGEDRYVLIGQSEGRILTVVQTERGDRIRIISARLADKGEVDAYYSAPR